MIVITGATGFLGSTLVYDLVTAGNEVRCLKRSTSAIPTKLSVHADKITWIEGDVNDIASLEELLEGCTLLYHCAAVVSFNPAKTAELYHINIEGTANVVNVALSKGIQKMVHVSSIAALGSVKQGLINEEVYFEETVSTSAYAISKHRSEMEVWRGIAEGLPAVIVNPSVIIGPTENWVGGFAPIVKRAYKGHKYYTDGVNGLVDVRDVSKAMIALMDSTKAKGRYILSGANVNFKDWFTLLNASFGHPAPRKRISIFWLEFAWRVAALYAAVGRVRNLLPRSIAKSAYEQNFYNSDKVKQELGFSFTPVEQTIEQTCKAYVEHLHATERRNN